MIKIVSKPEISPLKQVMLRVFAVIIALLCAAIFMQLMGYNPLDVYWQIIKGSLDPNYTPKTAVSENGFINSLASLYTNTRFQRTIAKTIPLVVLSLGTSVAFKMKS